MGRRKACATSLLIIRDVSVRTLIGDLMRHAGLDVRAVADGETGLAALDEAPAPRLILMDADVPEVQGRAFVEQLAQREVLAGVPCAALADSPAVEVPWAQHVLVKPVSIDLLLQLARASCADDDEGDDR